MPVVFNSVHKNTCHIIFTLLLLLLLLYEGESNENLKFVIKNRHFAPLPCKLVSVLQTACRMACKRQNSADA